MIVSGVESKGKEKETRKAALVHFQRTFEPIRPCYYDTSVTFCIASFSDCIVHDIIGTWVVLINFNLLLQLGILCRLLGHEGLNRLGDILVVVVLH